MPKTLRLREPPVTALLYTGGKAARRALVLAHGAGAPQTHPFIVRVATGLAARGIDVLTFNFAYAERASRRPDANAALEACWREAISVARTKLAGRALYIGGKSMGGRIATQVAALDAPDGVRGIVLLGYPLHPPSDPKRLRAAHLPDVKVPMLFVQGERDPFGGPSEIARVTKKLASVEIHPVPDGDHSFAIRKKSGLDADVVFESILDAVDAFTRRNAPNAK